MNLSRRTALAGGLTGAAGLIAGGAGAALADIGNPDAELLELCGHLDQLQAELKTWFKEQEAAYDRYKPLEPKKPEVLRVRKGDKALGLPAPEDWDPALKEYTPTDWYNACDARDLEKRPPLTQLSRLEGVERAK